MGMIKHFSSHYNDNGCNTPPIIKYVETRVNSTPDPKNFKIIRKEIINGYPILLINYPGVKNYEGNKILMYSKHFDLNYLNNKIDPHFFTDGTSPIARFEPTKYGWELATTLATNLL